MTSRAKHLKHLEHDLTASRKIINDLTRENYELREALRSVRPNTQHERTQSKQTESARLV